MCIELRLHGSSVPSKLRVAEASPVTAPVYTLFQRLEVLEIIKIHFLFIISRYCARGLSDCYLFIGNRITPM